MFGAGGGFNFGAAPTTSATGTSQAKPGFTFGGTATTAAGGFNFGQPGQSTAAASGLKTDAAPTQSGFTFGTTPSTSTTAPAGGFNFGTTSTSGAGGSGGGFSFGQSTATSGPSSSGFSFASPAGGPGAPGLGALGTSTTTAPTAGSSGFALGAATAAATPFGAATKTTTSGLAGFGIPSTTTKPEGGFTGSTGLGGAGTTTATASTAPSAGAFSLSVGSTSAPGVSTAAPVNPLLGSLLSNNPSSTVATGFSLAAPATTSVTGLSGAIPKTTPAASSTSTGTTTAGGLGGFGLTTSTAAITTRCARVRFPSDRDWTKCFDIQNYRTTAAPTVTTSGAPTGVPSRQMNYRQLEEQINKWMLELEEQEKEFLQQATQVNAWDRLLIENGEKITQLNQDTDKVRVDQDRLDHELDFIRSQQRELEDLLVPLEKSVEQLPGYSFQHHADLERENTYQLADNIDAQLKRMVQDLKEIIDHLNTSNSGQESNDPIQQITKILNAHMDSLQWLDSNTALIGRRVEDISKKMETQRKEQERNFRLVYD